MTKSKALTLSDFKLRIFVDTNVLIDYVEKFNKKNSVTFLNQFKKTKSHKKTKFENVELVTSDYVLWEFYGHSREECYAKLLIDKCGYSLISANKECRKGDFQHVSRKSMQKFADDINGKISEIIGDDQPVYLTKLIGQMNEGFSEIVYQLLQCSKFSYKDAIVLTSAYFTNSNIIVTSDVQFGTEINNIKELKLALKEWSINPNEIKYKQPSVFDNSKKIRKEYEEWFLERNKNKIIADVTHFYSRPKVIIVQCRDREVIKEKDYLCIVKFIKNKLHKYCFKVPSFQSGSFRDGNTKRPTQRGSYVTIKLRTKFDWKNAMVFLTE